MGKAVIEGKEKSNIKAIMRTAEGAYNYILEQDPGTAVSLHFIRMLIKQGKIRHIKAGNRFLINVNELLDYLEGNLEESVNIVNRSGIRKVEL